MTQRAVLARALAGFGTAIALSLPVLAQTLPDLDRQTHRLSIDSGELAPPRGEEPDIVYSTTVAAPGSGWVRVKFGPTTLAGDAAAAGATIRITSEEDGAVQFLTAEALKRWNYTSAYFNGDRVKVDVIGFPGNGPSRVRIEGVEAGGRASASLCGTSNRLLPSSDPAVARVLPMGCTAFLINDANRMLLSAGHCGIGAGSVVQFNVPEPGPDGSLRHPSPQDQYPVDAASVQSSNTGPEDDWAYFGVFPNSNTGLTPVQVQGAFHVLAESVRGPAGEVRVTGFGAAASPREHMTQRTQSGGYIGLVGTELRYDTDAPPGTDGAPVLDAGPGVVLGIHAASACTGAWSSGRGTSVDNPGLRHALANPRGVCASGVGPSPQRANLFAVGDAGNNFGALAAGGQYSALAQVVPLMQGLAYDPEHDRFFAIDSLRTLYTISAAGTVVEEGMVTGTTQMLNGLGYDPETRRLYAIAQATGQLFVIDVSTHAAKPVGAARGGNIGALDFDREQRVLYGIDDAPGGSRLVRLNTANGLRQEVGPLGQGVTDCNGLAWSEGKLYTINATNQHVLVINPANGQATSLGVTNGVFGSSYGLAARDVKVGCSADFDGDGDPGTDADVEAFFRAMAGSPCPTCGSTDIDGDGEASTDFDVEAFFRAMAGEGC
jgi:V8-like Glu-specific endopeptidase